MHIAVLVNGSPEKTNGVRVRELFRDIAATNKVVFVYRDDRHKLASLISFCRTVLKTSPDVIYVEGFGYAGIVAALVGKVVKGSRFVLSTGDDAYAFAKSCMNIIKAQVVGVVEYITLRVADVVAVWGQYHQAELEKRGLSHVSWIPGGVDTSVFRPIEVMALRASLGVDHVTTIGVVGSINWNARHSFCYGWEVLEVIRLLKGFPVAGMIVGVGSGVPVLKELAQQYGVENQMVFTGWIDHDVLPQYINAMDICISTQSNDLVGKVRITAKVPEYLACGRYIIASDVGGAGKFVRGAGLLLPYEGVRDNQYVKRIADHVVQVMRDRSILRTGERGIQTAHEVFDYSVLRPKLLHVLNGLTIG